MHLYKAFVLKSLENPHTNMCWNTKTYYQVSDMIYRFFYDSYTAKLTNPHTVDILMF